MESGGLNWQGRLGLFSNTARLRAQHSELPFTVRDNEGRVLCRTLGEAFLRNEGVMWLTNDTVLTKRDGCMVRTWA